MDGIVRDLTVSRRSLLKGGAAASLGLIIGFRVGADEAHAAAAPVAPGSFAPNAFIRIAPDSTVTVISKHMEMGQGTYTGIPTMIAEELDADWAQMRVEAAPVDANLYANLMYPMTKFKGQPRGTQASGGSMSVPNSWMQMRQAGATAKAMLVSAAAAQWKVPVAEVTVDKGVIHHAMSGRSGKFGEFVAAAMKLPVPGNVTLKDPKDFKLIGTYLPRTDTPAKTNGTAIYTMDIALPGMLTAMVQHSPRFGGKVASFDDAIARKVPGVVDVVPLEHGVAVLATSFWAAKKGRDAVQVVWDDSKAEMRSTTEIFAEYRGLISKPGKSARKEGDAAKAMASAAKRVSATYEFPYLAHAPMEPLDCVIKLTKESCEIWSGTQSPSRDQEKVCNVTGLELEQVKINVQYAGGGFGRRGTRDGDPTEEAIRIAHARGADGVPVKVIWQRDDDIRGGMYRPMVHHALEAGLDANGKIVAWKHDIAGQGFSLAMGANDLPYAIPNMDVQTHMAESPVSTAPLRSVDHTHTACAIEAFMDEIATEAGRDPVEMRRELLAKEERYLAVLNLAAEKGGWGEKMPAGRGRGVAVHFAMGSWVAQVVDITVNPNGSFKVDRVVCAVDCGIAVNPDIVRAQMEGGIGFGLGLALHGSITLKDGNVEQSNFDNYRVLRMAEMPKIDVHIVPSLVKPTGVGEPGVPPIAPGVANAYFAATGKRLRTLPFRTENGAA